MGELCEKLEAAREAFNRDGAVVLRDVFSQEWLQKVLLLAHAPLPLFKVPLVKVPLPLFKVPLPLFKVPLLKVSW